MQTKLTLRLEEALIRGILKKTGVEEKDFYNHLEEKYL